jgi:hypothetical protein
LVRRNHDPKGHGDMIAGLRKWQAIVVIIVFVSMVTQNAAWASVSAGCSAVNAGALNGGGINLPFFGGDVIHFSVTVYEQQTMPGEFFAEALPPNPLHAFFGFVQPGVYAATLPLLSGTNSVLWELEPFMDDHGCKSVKLTSWQPAHRTQVGVTSRRSRQSAPQREPQPAARWSPLLELI